MKHSHHSTGSRLYAARRRACLTQRELAVLIGYIDEGAVRRHERFQSVPPLLIALAYEVIFQIPAGDIFFGARDTIDQVVEQRLEALKKLLEEKPGRGRYATRNARKLEWIATRQS